MKEGWNSKQSLDDARPLQLSLLIRLFTFTRPYAGLRNMLLVICVLRALQLPAMAWCMSWVIKGPIAQGDSDAAFHGTLAFLCLATILNLCFHYRNRLALILGECVVHDLRQEIFKHLLNMPMSFYQKNRLGRMISWITSDVGYIRQGIQDVLFVSVVNFGQMFIAAGIMCYLDPTLFLVVVAIAPVIWGLNQIFHAKMSRAIRISQESFSRLTASLAESVNGIRVTQGFARQEANAGIFRSLVATHSSSSMEMTRVSATFLPLLELNSQFFVGTLLALGGYLAFKPDYHMETGNLIQFFLLSNAFFAPIQILGNMYNQAMMAMGGAERIFGLLDSKPDWTDGDDVHTLERPLEGSVEFQKVNFGYDPTKPVLHDVQFRVEPGQTIALVGHTGSGKTSIINLISKFYLPTSGKVLLDGMDILTLDTRSIHQQIGLVLQQNFLFSGTVMENIRFARPEASDDEVRGAAERLGCLDLIEHLPDGFQTKVGEKGGLISLGQRQLICFVRALLMNPRIMILDEATSSVDALTEAKIQNALNILLKGRTSFVIAHRLSTIRNADMVLVLDQGRIIERGSHRELVLKGGTYANLYKQFVQVDEPVG